MPYYEYRCSRCGVFETWQKITEDPLQKCPTCGEPVKRLIGRNIAVIYKAPGFYTTDNRPKETSGDPSSEGAGDKKPADSETGNSKDSQESIA